MKTGYHSHVRFLASVEGASGDYRRYAFEVFEAIKISPRQYPYQVDELRKRGLALGLSPDTIKGCEAAAVSALADLYCRDGQVTATEFQNIGLALTSFDLDVADIDDETSARVVSTPYISFRQELLRAHEIPQDFLLMKPNEVSLGVIWSTSLKHVTRRVPKGYVGGSISFRVAKGVRLSFGRAVPVSSTYTDTVVEAEGAFVVTSERLAFLASKKQFVKPYKDLAGYQPYADALELFWTNRQTSSLLYMQPGHPDFAIRAIEIALQAQEIPE